MFSAVLAWQFSSESQQPAKQITTLVSFTLAALRVLRVFTENWAFEIALHDVVELERDTDSGCNGICAAIKSGRGKLWQKFTARWRSPANSQTIILGPRTVDMQALCPLGSNACSANHAVEAETLMAL
jgi:hypothetical protein